MPVRRPKRQGAFDGACGFYAVHNALGLLYPNTVTEDDFSTLLYALSKSAVPRQFFAGTGRNELNQMLVRLVADDRFSRTVVSRPWWGGGTVALGDYWSRLESHLDGERAAAIVAFRHEPDPERTYYHWTVVRKVTTASLVLHDSAGLARLPRKRSRMWDEKASHASRPFALQHPWTFLLRRAEP